MSFVSVNDHETIFSQMLRKFDQSSCECTMSTLLLLCLNSSRLPVFEKQQLEQFFHIKVRGLVTEVFFAMLDATYVL